MEGKGFSKFVKSFDESEMSTTALTEAKGWYESLLDAEFRGRKDTDGAARYRLSSRLGVKENVLFRLQYRVTEMKDIAGEVYRRLKLAHDELCERNEEAARAMRAERLGHTGQTNAVDQERALAGVGMAVPEMASPEREET